MHHMCPRISGPHITFRVYLEIKKKSRMLSCERLDEEASGFMDPAASIWLCRRNDFKFLHKEEICCWMHKPKKKKKLKEFK